MTKKEINEFLANTKVYVNGKSKEIQEKLFSFGYKWNNECTDVSFTCSPFLFIYTDMSFARSGDMEYFSKYENREITAEQILALEVTEIAYRPFKDTEECWQEMLKHQPFGWIIYDDSHIHIHEVGYGEITCLHNEEPWCIEFKEAINCIKFADGSPFGIKEE